MKSDLLSEHMANLIVNISEKYFVQDMPVAVQVPISLYSSECKPKRRSKTTIMTTRLDILMKYSALQFVTSGCFTNSISDDVTIKPGSAIVFLAEEDLQRQLVLAEGLVQRIYNRLRNEDLRIILVSSLESTSRRDRDKAALQFLSDMWQKLKASDVIVLFLEVGWSRKANNQVPSIEIYSWIIEKQHDRCLRKLSVATLMDVWLSAEQRFISNNYLFPSRFIKDMGRCKWFIRDTEFPPFVYITKDYKRKVFLTNGVFYFMLKAITDVIGGIMVDFNPKKVLTPDIDMPVSVRDKGTELDECQVPYTHFRQSLL